MLSPLPPAGPLFKRVPLAARAAFSVSARRAASLPDGAKLLAHLADFNGLKRRVFYLPFGAKSWRGSGVGERLEAARKMEKRRWQSDFM